MKEKFINPYLHCFGNIISNVNKRVSHVSDFYDYVLNELGCVVPQTANLLPFELDGSAFDLDPKDPFKFEKVDVPITLGTIEDQVSSIESYINSVKSQLESLKSE